MDFSGVVRDILIALLRSMINEVSPTSIKLKVKPKENDEKQYYHFFIKN